MAFENRNFARSKLNYYRVDGGRERYAAEQYQQVAQRQTKYVNVGHVDHVLVPEEYQNQRPVADGAHEEYEREQHGHDVRLRPLRVIVLVRGVVGRVVCVAAVHFSLSSPPVECSTVIGSFGPTGIGHDL